MDQGPVTFSEALAALKMCKKLTREGWNGKGMFIFYNPPMMLPVLAVNNVFPVGHIVKCRPFIVMKTADDAIVPWLASQTDILAEDWYTVE